MTQYPPHPSLSGPDAVARLTAQVRQLRALAFGGVAIGLFATALAAFGLARTPQVAVGPQAVPAAPATSGAAPTASQTKAKPADAGAAAPSTIVLGAAGKGLPVLDIFEDFQCPACAQVEVTFGPEVDALVAGGNVEVRYHLMTFLDENLRNDASSRASAGAFCAHDQGKFLAWHDVLFAAANRPATEGDGWTDAQLAGFAAQAGLDASAWSACVAGAKHAPDVDDANQLSLAAGVSSTPTYRLNGAKLNLNAVLAAGGLKAWVAKNG